MKTLCLAVATLFVMLFGAGPLLAQDTVGGAAVSGNAIGAGFGAAITILGAGWGFGRIGAAALESMARQPETAVGRIQTAMLIIAALLEGATFFSLIVCILMALRSAGLI